MTRGTRRTDRSTGRVVRNKVLEVLLLLAFLALILTVVLPWAGDYLADSFARQIQAP